MNLPFVASGLSPRLAVGLRKENEMDDATFMRQLCSWLDPFRLASLSQQYMENPGQLERRVIATRVT